MLVGMMGPFVVSRNEKAFVSREAGDLRCVEAINRPRRKRDEAL